MPIKVRHNMMDSGHTPERDADVLGYHLGVLDEAASSRVESAFADPDALASTREAIEWVLSPLKADVVPPAPPGLIRDILARVEQARSPVSMMPRMAGADRPAGSTEAGSSGGPPLSLRELVGLAAAIALFVGVFVPGYRTARRAAERTACMGVLHDLGTGYAGYAEANSGLLPFVGGIPPGATWLPVRQERGHGRPINSRNLYQLVRGHYVAPEALFCPTRAGAGRRKSRHNSSSDGPPDLGTDIYSTSFLQGPFRLSMQPRMPIAADVNPLVDSPQATRMDVPLNSLSHGRPGGQNVLWANLSVRWSPTPNVGIDRDDIYRIANIREYTGRELPRSQTDAFLIP
ncbi:MAG: hypothetical protein ACE5F9_12000 [Phycisphaerae bacterium]